MSQLPKRSTASFRRFLESSLEANLYHFDRRKPKLPLMIPSYSVEEVLEAVDTLLSTNVTMGEKVFKFEERFAAYTDCKYGIMVNSGSSANLLAVSTLTNPMLKHRLHQGFEAIIPAVTWSTTMFPISNCGGVPVLCDVDPDNFIIKPQFVRAGLTGKTSLVVPVHLLGNPCDVDSLRKSNELEGVAIMEDSCEAHGAEVRGKKVGSFGDLGTFSFYFSHHISTIEGGMLVTNNEELAEISRMLRAHGWVREVRKKGPYLARSPSIDPRFLFVNLGYNLRPTELQGAFGLHQLKRLEGFISARRANARYLSKRLRKHERHISVQNEVPGTRHVWFGYPVTVSARAPFSTKDLVSFLERRGIQTRPIMAGNLAEQPATALIRHRLAGRLPHARMIMRQSFFIGNHHGLNTEALDYIISTFDDFFEKFK